MHDLGELRKAFGNGTQDEVAYACNLADPKVTDYQGAKEYISKLVNTLLVQNRYRAAAHVLWGTDLFDPRPKSVAKILRAIETHQKIIILGSASSGKSYSCVAYLLLAWLKDPEYTAVRIISTTGGHALDNAYSSMQRFYKESIIPLPGVSQHGFIGLDTNDRHASIKVIAIKEGQDGKTSLQGLHPIRRRVPHPVFGKLSRVLIFLDECELIPKGVWRGVGNMLSNLQGDILKVIAACNPWDVTSQVASNAEPREGYNRIDVDKDTEWMSKANWHTIRVDAAYSENVLQKRVVYDGLMTYEGFEEKRSKADGDSPEYWCYGRGMYPLQGSTECLIPLNYLDDFYGEFIFQAGTSVGCAGVDLAFEGDDDCIFFAGRCGKALAFKPAGSTKVINLAESRFVVQLDQFVTLKKAKTEAQYNQIKKQADLFGISYDWIAIDKTGNGTGVADLFYERGYKNMMAIGWGQRATHTKFLSQSRNYCDEIYDGISTEMMYCLRYYLELGYVKASPNIDMSKLLKEIIGRKRVRSRLGPTGEVMYRLEEKAAFKNRYGFSPDRCDAMIMAINVARQRGSEKAEITKKKRVWSTGTYGASDPNVEFVDFSSE